MTNLDDTQPQRAVEKLDDTKPKRPANFPPQQTAPPGYYYADHGGLSAPPRILLWGIIGLFVLGILGAVAGVYVFREVFTPGQQQRVMNILPFMEAFMPPRPAAGDTLPAPATVDEEAAQNLLNNPLTLPGGNTDLPAVGGEATEEPEPTQTSEPTVEPTEEPTPESTPETALEVAAAPTAVPEIPTATIEPTTAPLEPTQAPPAESESSTRTWDTEAFLGGVTYHDQTWNNCGPATVTMALSYYGWARTQEYAASFLKPYDEDKNVSPHELVRFVDEQTDIQALTRMGGDLDLLRTLITNQFPVIIERSHMFEGYDWIGHYQFIGGYNDTQRIFTIYDSFLGNGELIFETYDEVDAGWQDFNRTFVVIYTPDREAFLMNLLGTRANPDEAALHAFEVAQQEAMANPQDAFPWFNMGTSLVQLERFREAATAYDKAFELRVPWRMLWYQFGPFEAYYEQGRYNDIISLVNNNLSNGGEYVEETYYWQGRVLAARGDTAGARIAFRNALSRNRLFQAAQDALDQLNA